MAMLVSFSLFVFPSASPMRFLRSNRGSVHDYTTVGSPQRGRSRASSINDARPFPALLSWNTAQRRLAWDVVFLLGAGFALAKACEVTLLDSSSQLKTMVVFSIFSIQFCNPYRFLKSKILIQQLCCIYCNFTLSLSCFVVNDFTWALQSSLRN